jgi:hypothetical protein
MTGVLPVPPMKRTQNINLKQIKFTGNQKKTFDANGMVKKRTCILVVNLIVELKKKKVEY